MSTGTARKLAAKRVNERIKHVATFLNALGIGTIGAGVIIPATKTPIEITFVGLFWLAGGFALHVAGHMAYTLMRSEDCIMTWALTFQMLIFVAVVSIGGVGYCAWLARDFDRRYGEAQRPDPAK